MLFAVISSISLCSQSLKNAPQLQSILPEGGGSVIFLSFVIVLVFANVYLMWRSNKKNISKQFKTHLSSLDQEQQFFIHNKILEMQNVKTEVDSKPTELNYSHLTIGNKQVGIKIIDHEIFCIYLGYNEYLDWVTSQKILHVPERQIIDNLIFDNSRHTYSLKMEDEKLSIALE